jgi:hypothetical protein
MAAEWQKISAPKSAKYPVKLDATDVPIGCQISKGFVGKPRIWQPVKPLQKRLNDGHPIGVTNSNI